MKTMKSECVVPIIPGKVFSSRFSVIATICCLCMAMLGTAMGEADGESDLDAYNVVWDVPSRDSSESMAWGGGDIGLNVWVENGEVLFYMQRSGSLAEQNEYLKLGRVRLRLDPNPFDAKNVLFRQELRLREGYIEIRMRTGGDDVDPLEATVRVWVEVKRPIVRLDIESSQPVRVMASYENWRLLDEKIPNDGRRRSFFSLNNYPGEVVLSKDHVAHSAGGVLFYHRNPGTGTLVDMLIEQQELGSFRDQIADDLSNRTFGGLLTGAGFKAAGESEGKYQTASFKAWSLASEEPARRHHLRIVTHIAQTDTIDAWRKGLVALIDASAGDREEALRKTRVWWAGFWNRSWIAVNPEKGDPADKGWRVGRNYNLFRYQLGCNAFGEYPSKFNGGNFTYDANLVGGQARAFGPDWRNWGGGVFTAQNQRLLYWPMLKSGDVDAILPQFELYRKALAGARARVQAHFDHDGAVYSEYIGVPGLALGAGYGWKSGPRSRGREIPFGDARADAAQGYNSVVEKGVMANNCIAYHWESQLENTYMILEYHRFTGADITRYIPFVENAVVFFDEHYRKREKMRTGRELDARDKLVIFPSTSCESYRGATNPTDVLAGLQACLEGIIELDDGLLELRDRAYYRAFLESLPPFTYGEIKGDRIVQPAATWKRYQNVECPQFYPLFPFNRFDLLGRDHDHLQIFRDTWEHGTFPKNMVQSWHQDGIFFARMGMTDEARQYNSRKLDDSPRRFPTFWGPGHDWVPDHNWGGSGMLGLQEMLMHTVGNEIRLLPAWPKSWDVDFKLHAPHKTTVEARVRNGKLLDLKITPDSRKKDVVVQECAVMEFSPERDLLSLHYDHAPDRDDGQSAAADRTILETLFGSRWIEAHVVPVSGAYGKNASRFNARSDAVMDEAWNDCGGWLAADENRERAVSELTERWIAVLMEDGIIWVKEGGQSDITADVVKRIKSEAPAIDTADRINVVQHSKWNENQTTDAALAYARGQTRYIKIRDANAYLNIKGGDEAFVKAANEHAVFGNVWKAAFEYYNPRNRLDFSDTGELMYILGLGEIGIEEFRRRFLIDAETKDIGK